MTPVQRVLVVNHVVALGGAELTLLDLLRTRPDGVEVTLAAPEEGLLTERARQAGAAVALVGPGRDALAYRRLEAPLQPWKSLRAAAGLVPGLSALARLARSHDVVVTNSTKAHLYGGLGAQLARRPCAWRMHDTLDGAGFSPGVRRIMLTAARALADRVLAVSETVAVPLRRAGVRDVRVLPNGVDLDRLVQPAGARQRIRADLGIAPDARVVLMLGRIAPMKGAETLLDALVKLPGVHAVLAGDAIYSEDPGFAAALRARAAMLGGRVVFTGFRDDVPALLAAADVLAHPSLLADSLPTAILEALGAGVPVVASSAGGAAEILAGDSGGILFSPGDAAALAHALDGLLHDEAAAADARAAGLRRARDYALLPAYRRVWEGVVTLARPGKTTHWK